MSSQKRGRKARAAHRRERRQVRPLSVGGQVPRVRASEVLGVALGTALIRLLARAEDRQAAQALSAEELQERALAGDPLALEEFFRRADKRLGVPEA